MVRLHGHLGDQLIICCAVSGVLCTDVPLDASLGRLGAGDLGRALHGAGGSREPPAPKSWASGGDHGGGVGGGVGSGGGDGSSCGVGCGSEARGMPAVVLQQARYLGLRTLTRYPEDQQACGSRFCAWAWVP